MLSRLNLFTGAAVVTGTTNWVFNMMWKNLNIFSKGFLPKVPEKATIYGSFIS